ncbi:MAG TPA: phosphoenolpyruvate--protein phosphotransferase [Verrucomicrobiae bacterium]|nr:phosphoenolpyruvate--protein phosphotransferase [Verrucomicrobiae bacterium]
MAVWLAGIGVSRGVAIGRVQRILGGDGDIPEYLLGQEEVEPEIERFTAAQKLARDQLREVRKQIPRGLPGEIAAFIDTHLLMLDDRSLKDAVIAIIRQTRINAEVALLRQRDQLIQVFEQMEDPYLRTRKDDVSHVADRILRILIKSEKGMLPKAGATREPQVIVADDLAPADVILMAQQHVVAFITEYGGPLSHTAILARSIGLPGIVGLHGARRLLQEDELLIVDGEPGHALASPDAGALKFYRAKQDQQAATRKALGKLKDKAAVSRDGQKITLLANIELPEDAKHAAKMGAEGVGLYRTEFLYMNREGLPGEEEQYEAYSRVVSSVKGPITIRTLDLGADKQVDSGRAHHGPTPNNPALGLRAIRLCLREPELFRSQVRALLRASAHGNVKIMLPMISSLQEFKQARALMDSARAELVREKKKVGENVEIGAMIEVPAAAISAPILARHAKFFSIGTNDLIQYTLAIDRVDDEVNYLYDPLHPAVLQLIRQTIQAGDHARIPVAMCGEMAGDPRYTRLLLGLGLTEFSMHPAGVLEVKRLIIESDIGQLRTRVAEILDDTDGSRLREDLEALTHA